MAQRNELAEKIGMRLRSARIQQGMSLRDVEDGTGGRFKASAVGAYERGERVIPSDKLVEIAKVYEISTFRLLNLER